MPLFTGSKFGFGHPNAVAADAGGGGGGASPTGHDASGGLITEYGTGPTAYRAHTFIGSGSFVVSSLGEIDNEVDIFLVGGGGGGGASTPGSSWGSGGGGAGGAVLVPGYTISAQTYPITLSLIHI